MVTAANKTPTSTKSATSSTTKKVVAATKVTPKETAVAKTPAAKVAVKKAAVPKAVAIETKPTKAPAVKKATAKKKEVSVSPEHRYHMIATAAYYRAEHRGFAGGYEMQDWISAEAEIDAQL
ncbi:MAG: hypothetical protein FD173_1879 [Gallionellaceae bacterium]|nr:MAG: hypothetical protein FD173_1879 [Gallionellaceae bacterium]